MSPARRLRKMPEATRKAKRLELAGRGLAADSVTRVPKRTVPRGLKPSLSQAHSPVETASQNRDCAPTKCKSCQAAQRMLRPYKTQIEDTLPVEHVWRRIGGMCREVTLYRKSSGATPTETPLPRAPCKREIPRLMPLCRPCAPTTRRRSRFPGGVRQHKLAAALALPREALEAAIRSARKVP